MSSVTTDLFGSAPPASRRVVPVMVPMPAPRPYSYAVPEDIDVVPGSIVQVPLGPRQVFGVVWDGETDDAVDPRKLRPISKAFDCPPIRDEQRRFLEWVANYTLSPPGLVVRMALRAPAAFDPEPMVEGLKFTGHLPERMTPSRRRVIDLIEDGLSWTRSGLAHAAGVSTGVIDGLASQGTVETVFLPPAPIVPPPDPDFVPSRLEGVQSEAAEQLLEEVRARSFGVALINGITGSGKTEVYFEAIAETLRQGRQVLILLPEIALTASFLERFRIASGQSRRNGTRILLRAVENVSGGRFQRETFASLRERARPFSFRFRTWD